jgi:hypothetical protein
MHPEGSKSQLSHNGSTTDDQGDVCLWGGVRLRLFDLDWVLTAKTSTLQSVLATARGIPVAALGPWAEHGGAGERTSHARS